MDVVSYTTQFRASHAGRPVVSGFGVWLLLAGVGALGGGQQAHAEALLDDMPDGVRCAVAWWRNQVPERARVFELLLPEFVEVGRIPTQGDADRWVADRTDGLVRGFPSLDWLEAVVSSTVAVRTEWPAPLGLVEPARSGWFTGGRQVCVDYGARVLDTSVGRVGASVLTGTNGLVLAQVVGPRGMSPASLGVAAREAATGVGRVVDPASLRAGDDDFVVVVERRGSADSVRGLVPCWRGRSEFDVSGAPHMADMLGGLGGLYGGVPTEAVQVGVAGFNQFGFEAAALTALCARGLPPQADRMVREVTVVFDRPFAAHATWFPPATVGDEEIRPVEVVGVWDGVPLFDMWVSEQMLTDPATRTPG